MTWKLDYNNFNQNMKEFNDLWSYSSYYDDYERVFNEMMSEAEVKNHEKSDYKDKL